MTNKVKIKLIYGENGAGKTFYYKSLINNENFICLNYDIANWYDYKEKKFSQWNYISKENIENIKTKFSYILDTKNKNSIPKYFGINNKKIFTSFLKDNDFDTFEQWYSYHNDMKNKNYEYVEKDLEKYSNVFYIWKDFNKFKSILENISNDEFEILKVFVNIQYNKINDLSAIKAIFYQNSIINIIEDLKKEIPSIDINRLEKIEIDLLEKIKNNRINMENISEIIKNVIIKFEEVQELFELKDNLNSKKNNCLNFNNLKLSQTSEIKIADDGYSLEGIDLGEEKYSSGQRVVYIFNLLLNIFSQSGKEIILDDIFEKLDIKNTVNLIIDILECCKKNEEMQISILTHDINFINLFQSVLNNYGEEKKYFNKLLHY